MSEPKAIATEISEVVPGVWYWHLSDERIGGSTGAAHAVRADSGVVLIDPLPLAEDAMESLGPVEAICLTTSGHQRSSWRLRSERGVPVWAPSGAQAVDEEPDGRYDEGDRLAGGLLAHFTPGAGTRQFSLLLQREGGVLFTPDLFINPPDGEFGLVPAQYMHDPDQVQASIESLLDLEFAVLCTGHGLPVAEGPKAAIRAVLASG